MSRPISLGAALGWKYNHAEGMTTIDNELADWPNSLGPRPNVGELAQIITEYQAYVASTQYKEDRAKAYPPILDQLDMLFEDLENGTTTFQDAIRAIKAQFPKPGP